MRFSALRVIALVMLPAFAHTAETVYAINGTFGSNEQGCTQISLLFGGSDCTFGRNRPGAAGTWIGPLFSGAHYIPDGIKDVITYVPTSGVFDAGTETFAPAVDDGKYAAPITGTFTIDDNGTPGDPTDDLISANFSIGAMARNIASGQSTRAVQRWTSMDHVVAATPVNGTATVTNGAGGADYVIGSRGFPAPLCSATDNADCFATPNASAVFTDFDANDVAVSFWAQITAGGIGIERTGLLGDPAFVVVEPPPNPPTGNVGATSTATFTGYSCDDSFANDLDCNSNALVWQGNGPGTGGEPAGFDNMVMKISTNSDGEITSAFAYWTEEYAIGFGGSPAGYDNSWQGGSLSFTGLEQSLAPNARDFAVAVLESSTTNTLDTVANSVHFAGPITVTIVTAPAGGIATVNGDQTLNFDASGVGAGTQSIVYEATDGTDADQGTITITVAADVSPVAPDGTITISTQGAAPGAATVGQVNVATFPGYSAGNGPAIVSITTPPDVAGGTATVTGTTIRFTPAATFFSGTATIAYTITDSSGDTDTGVITVTIADLSPGIANGAITTDQGTTSPALALGITPGNGSVAQHTLAVTTAATSGTCAISGTSLTYTPNAGFAGIDSCVVSIVDGDGDTDTGTITITVNNSFPDGFVFTDQIDVAPSSQITSDPVVITGIAAPVAISVGGDVSSKYSINGAPFTSSAGTIGNGNSVRVRHISSAAPDTSVDTVLEVGGVTDTFTSTTLKYAIDDNVTTEQDQSVQIDVLQNDNGLGATVYVGIWVDPTHGSADVSGAPGSPSGIRITYTPNPGFAGTDVFEYWVESGLAVDYAVVNVTVINADPDGDGLVGALDNCTLVANPSQCDSDGDGYGNHCDGDLTNNGFTNAQDSVVLRSQLGKPSVGPTFNKADLNCNGFVNAQDTVLFRQLLASPPGPSGLHP